MAMKQRSREEITADRIMALKNSTQAAYFNTRQSATQEAILEVLLDIRDKLNAIHQVMPEASQFETD